MIVVESNEVRNIEKEAVRNGISMSTLMEQAGAAVAEFATKIISQKQLKKITILCGKGNNGGDGFVVARFLSMMFEVSVIISEEPQSELAKLNFNLIPEKVKILNYSEEPFICAGVIEESELLIDALYGIGFRDALDAVSGEMIVLCNQNRKAIKIAVDIPSGIICNTGEIINGCFEADYTITFSVLKPLHVLYPSMDHCGEISVVNIGIPENIIRQATYTMRTTDEYIQKNTMPVRRKSAHKGMNGTLLSVCGSYGMAGAAVLSGTAALRCGIGLLKSAVPKSIYPIVAPKLTESVFMPLEEDENGEVLPEELNKVIYEIIDHASAALIGCGMGQSELMQSFVSAVIQNSTKPLVIDADGINSICDNIDVLRGAVAPIILTPHPAEMARMTNLSTMAVQASRYKTARDFAGDYGVTVVLKGANTIIALPDGNAAYINLTGNNGMAKGGSGDVLAGMIASFLAQGMSTEKAAVMGVYYHGLAGDKAAQKYSPRTMLPSDILEELKYLF